MEKDMLLPTQTTLNTDFQPGIGWLEALGAKILFLACAFKEMHTEKDMALLLFLPTGSNISFPERDK